MGSGWGCPDLTDSGLGYKTQGVHMKTQMRKPVSGKASYSDEYKQQTLGKAKRVRY
jgi:hypothetical protein